jgi:lysophospholipase L1-like esterase
MKPLPRKIAFAIVTNALLVGGAEVAVRATWDASKAVAPPDLEFMNADFGAGFPIARDPALFWKLVPSARLKDLDESINSLGFRGPEVAARKPPGTRRVLCLGDSNGFGIGVSEDATFSRRLERWLRASGEPWEVINAGCPGYSIYQMWRILELRGTELAPDVVVVYAGAWNDFMPAVGGSDEQNALRMQRWERGRRIFGLGKSHLLRWIEATWFRDSQPADTGDGSRPASKREAYARAFFTKHERPEGERVPPEAFRRHLQKLSETTHRLGAQLIFIIPALPAKSRKAIPDGDAYAGEVARVAAELKLPAAGVREALASMEATTPGLFFDSVHPGETGHAVIARELADIFLNFKIVAASPVPPADIVGSSTVLKAYQAGGQYETGDPLRKTDSAAAAGESPDQIVVAVPSRLRVGPLPVPAQAAAILLLSCAPHDAGLQPGGTPIEWIIQIETGDGAPEVLFRKTISYAGERWTAPTRARVDLAKYAGKNVHLSLSVNGNAFRASWGPVSLCAVH